MLTIYQHELKTNLKTLLIWSVCVGGMGFACILLFSSMKESMEGMASNFASMGAFSDAFGMSQLSIATFTGFYATEVGTIHSLGGAMFAAIISSNMLSKEEDGHTGEFLFSLPLSRGKAVTAKWCALLSDIVLFNLICVCMYWLGSMVLAEHIAGREFYLYHSMQLLMQIEIAAVCYFLSACSKRNRPGVGLGVVLILYAFDLIARVVPDLSDYKIITPFSYANAADVLSSGEVCTEAVVIGIAALALGAGAGYVVYTGKDLAS